MVDGYIDVHIHPIKSLVKPAEIIKEMDESGVSRGILLGLDIDKKVLLDKKVNKLFRRKLANSLVWDIEREVELALNILDVGRCDNFVVKEFVNYAPNRFIGFGSINPRFGKKYVKEKFNEVLALELRGLKIIPTLQFFDPSKSSELELIWKMSNDNDLIITYHTGCDPGPWEYIELCKVGAPSKIIKLLRKYETRVILAHSGAYSARKPGIWVEEALRLANKYEHVWLDTSAVPYLVHDEKFVEKVRDFNVLEKILFGSDYPVVQGLDIRRAIRIIQLSPILSVREKNGILRDNALKLLKNIL